MPIFLKKLFPRRKAHPDQAGFIRRGLAFCFDLMIIYIISALIFIGFSEFRAWIQGEPGPISLIIDSFSEIQQGEDADIAIGPSKITGEESLTDYQKLSDEEAEADDAQDEFARNILLMTLENQISAEEYEEAQRMSYEELKLYFDEVMESKPQDVAFYNEKKLFEIIRELIVGYLYFALFFRFGGRTLGKRLFGLKIIDLHGRKHLNLYRAIERAHGYIVSGLYFSLGFWQVLWDPEGLTMHDKIVGTTVIRTRGRRKKKMSERKVITI